MTTSAGPGAHDLADAVRRNPFAKGVVSWIAQELITA